MGAETPAAGRGFVDRAADERVPEAKAARHICGTDEIAAQELVERLDTRRRVDARRRRHQLGLERVAGHRRSFEHPARLPGEQRELLGERRGHRGRHLDAPDGRARGQRRSPEPERARELLEVEGIAAALLVQRGRIDAASEELARLLERERRELKPREPSRTVGTFERPGQPLRDLSWPDRHRE